LFELIRPAVLVLSALLSTWVFASARRHAFSFPVALAWALATLVFPLIIVPLYLIARSRRKRTKQTESESEPPEKLVVPTPRLRVVAPMAYAAIVLSGLGIYLYRDYQDVDSHLARAAHAKLRGNRNRTIEEYRAALRQGDDAHTHKLLAIELADVGFKTEAVSEFRLAEKGGEPDELIPFRIASLLDAIGQPNQAVLEYRRFLQSKACTQELPDRRCETAMRRTGNT
jgi:hypothetical protein